MLNVEVYCLEHSNESERRYKSIGNISMADISYIPIGSHVCIGTLEVVVISYYIDITEKVKMIVEVLDRYADADVMYSKAIFN